MFLQLSWMFPTHCCLKMYYCFYNNCQCYPPRCQYNVSHCILTKKKKKTFILSIPTSSFSFIIIYSRFSTLCSSSSNCVTEKPGKRRPSIGTRGREFLSFILFLPTWAVVHRLPRPSFKQLLIFLQITNLGIACTVLCLIDTTSFCVTLWPLHFACSS